MNFTTPNYQQTHCPPPQKYSLRSRYPQKIVKEDPHSNNTFLPGSFAKDQSIGRPFQNNHHYMNSEINISYLMKPNSFQNPLHFQQKQKNPQVVIPLNYRTPSTNNSIQNGFQAFTLQPTYNKPEPKYSLKNYKKEQNPKTKFTYTDIGQQSDKHSQIETFSQHINSAQKQPIQDIISQIGPNNKFSLKSGTRKGIRPEVLLNLKYEDLSGLTKNKSNLYLHIPFSNSHFREIDICNVTNRTEEGCHCNPNCLWVNSWLIKGDKANLEQKFVRRTNNEWQEIVKQIQRDLPRTQPEHPAFQKPRLKQMMKEVLIGYAKIDSEVGYVQGMNFVAAVLVFHSRNSSDALKIFKILMQTCGYRQLFLGDLSFGRGLALRLSTDLRKLVFDLHCHLSEEGIDLELFASSWYFSLCGSFVPLEAMHLIVDKFLKKGFQGINEIILTLLLFKKELLVSLHDSHLMMQFSNQRLNQTGLQIDWSELCDRSDRLLLSPLY